MNRRGFLGLLCSGVVGACVVAKIPTAWIPAPIQSRALMFKGVPLVFDQYCPSSTIYFLNSKGVYRLDGVRIENLSDLTKRGHSPKGGNVEKGAIVRN